MDWNDPTNIWGVIHGGLLFAIFVTLSIRKGDS